MPDEIVHSRRRSGVQECKHRSIQSLSSNPVRGKYERGEVFKISFQSIIFECHHLIHSPHSRSLVPGGRRQDDLRVTDTAAAAVAEVDVVHGGRVAAEDDQRLERRHNEHDNFRAVGHSQRAAVPAELDARDLQVLN